VLVLALVPPVETPVTVLPRVQVQVQVLVLVLVQMRRLLALTPTPLTVLTERLHPMRQCEPPRLPRSLSC
jgi:hypothetical protein